MGQIRVGSAVFVQDGEKLLLGCRAKDPARGQWIVPGGKIEFGESIADAGAREIREETGLEIKIVGQAGTFEIVNPPSEHRIIVYSWAVPIGGALKSGSDLSGVRFVAPDEAAQIDLTPFMRHVLAAIGWLPSDVRLRPRG